MEKKKTNDESYLYIMPPEVAENVRKTAILEGNAQRIIARMREIPKRKK